MQTRPAKSGPVPLTAAGKSPGSRTVTPVGRFLAELGGMCAVMCMGGGILSFASFAVASGLGYPNLVRRRRSFLLPSSPPAWPCRWPDTWRCAATGGATTWR
jgi:hypothetical protein